MAEVTLMPLIFFTIFYFIIFFSNIGELNFAHAGQTLSHWATSSAPDIIIIIIIIIILLWLYWAWTQDFMLVKQHSTAWAI
jgi:hypothetical protein